MTYHKRKPHVLILGGGVAGLSAAHELIDRGFRVTVLEARSAGGKARSIFMPNTGKNGRRDLPGEHGFRFFPGFYSHLPDTMKRIPFGNNPRGVFDNLVQATRTESRTIERGSVRIPNRLPSSFSGSGDAMEFIYRGLAQYGLGIPQDDVHYYIIQNLSYMTSCEGRRYQELEYTPALEYLGASSRSPEYQNYMVSGITKTLVACKGADISARSACSASCQLVFDFFRNGADRLLNGPTNDVWIDPWLAHLRSQGVEFIVGAEVQEFKCAGNRVTGVRTLKNGQEISMEADHYVAALPVEVMARLASPEMKEVEPRLDRLQHLVTDWMVGTLYFLDRPIPVNHGHTIFLDSPWALTAVAQDQFWPRFDLSQFGDGRVRGILSVCISDWTTPGVKYKKTAKECTADEIREEVWCQMLQHHTGKVKHAMENAKIINWFLCPDIDLRGQGKSVNSAPLMLNTVGSWDNRPDALTAFENLFLASDYVRTYTDLATMESANEAARRAVNGILSAEASNEQECELWPLRDPLWAAPLQALDRMRFESGMPHILSRADLLSGGTKNLVREVLEKAAYGSGAVVSALQRIGWDSKLFRWEWKVASSLSMMRYWFSEPAFDAFSPASDQVQTVPKNSHSEEIIEQLMAPQAIADLEFQVRDVRSLLERQMSLIQKNMVPTDAQSSDDKVFQSMRQILNLPGKRIRALCAILSASVVGRNVPESVHHVALAAELVHASSLLHDDIIDEAKLRRGEPSAYLKYGTSPSLLAGNLVATRAVRLLLETRRPDLSQQLLQVIEGMNQSEVLQLQLRGTLQLDQQEYFKVIDGKTAGLFRWACAAGGSVVTLPKSQVDALADFGFHLGRAFQLADDILDFSGDSKKTGKDEYSDISNGLLSFPFLVAMKDPDLRGEIQDILADRKRRTSRADQLRIMNLVREADGIARTRELAKEHAQKAIRAADRLPWGLSRKMLQNLAIYSVERDK